MHRAPPGQTVTVIARLTALVAGLLSRSPGSAGPAANRRSARRPDGRRTAAHLVLHVPRPPVRLVINLRRRQTGSEQAAVTSYNAVADQYGFVVAYPTGSTSSWSRRQRVSVPDRQVSDVGFPWRPDRPADPRLRHPARPKVFVTGMSCRRVMANRLACRRADLVPAVAPVAGTLGVRVLCNPSRPVSVLQIHGTTDRSCRSTNSPMVRRGGQTTSSARRPGRPVARRRPRSSRRRTNGARWGPFRRVRLRRRRKGGLRHPSTAAVTSDRPAFDAPLARQFFASHG